MAGEDTRQGLFHTSKRLAIYSAPEKSWKNREGAYGPVGNNHFDQSEWQSGFRCTKARWCKLLITALRALIQPRIQENLCVPVNKKPFHSQRRLILVAVQGTTATT